MCANLLAVEQSGRCIVCVLVSFVLGMDCGAGKVWAMGAGVGSGRNAALGGYSLLYYVCYFVGVECFKCAIIRVFIRISGSAESVLIEGGRGSVVTERADPFYPSGRTKLFRIAEGAISPAPPSAWAGSGQKKKKGRGGWGQPERRQLSTTTHTHRHED